MGLRIACIVFPDGAQMYTLYSTVADQCDRELLPLARDEAAWLTHAQTSEDIQHRWAVLRQRQMGPPGAASPLETPVPTDAEPVQVTVPGYDDAGWPSRAMRQARTLVGPTSADEVRHARDREHERASDRLWAEALPARKQGARRRAARATAWAGLAMGALAMGAALQAGDAITTVGRLGAALGALGVAGAAWCLLRRVR
jgi:hypothetical protein